MPNLPEFSHSERSSFQRSGHQDHERNQQTRQLYHLGEATSKDTPEFVSMFAKGGHFYDVSAG
jgi:hypothetical protein